MIEKSSDSCKCIAPSPKEGDICINCNRFRKEYLDRLKNEDQENNIPIDKQKK